MASNVGIVNAALIMLGEATISSLDDNVKAARLANLIFEDKRDAVLEAHPWHFARARASLAAAVPAPLWGPTYAYNLPAEPAYCLRVLAIENDDLGGGIDTSDTVSASFAVGDSGVWRVEGRQIVTDEGPPLNIRYIKRVTDPNEFSALFREALSALLASELAEPLKQSSSLKEQLYKLYLAKLAMARTSNAMQGTPEGLFADEWLSARA